MKINNINSVVKESPDDWDVKACLFVTQEIGRFSVKFSAPCIGGHGEPELQPHHQRLQSV
ncbi:hypothetical protein [Serratia marcescens]|uniref:hypothetical protein n=1 Tax=Serratia marcescens TaxID=615 RepID=UPI0021AB5208|nr:hypothetical protein [Serratia marcescens]